MTDPNSYRAMPDFFYIKVGKKLQQEKKEKEGMFYYPESYAFMQREVQFGEIVDIGEDAKSFMSMADKGDYLLIHHMISGKTDKNKKSFYLVDEDDDFNYYAVNAYEIPGEMSLSYAIAKGEEIIPTPDYIFLELPKQEKESDL